MHQTALICYLNTGSDLFCLEDGAHFCLADCALRYLFKAIYQGALMPTLLAITGAGLWSQVPLPGCRWLAREGSQVQARELY